MRPLIVVLGPSFSTGELGELQQMTDIISVPRLEEIKNVDKVNVIVYLGGERIDRDFISRARSLRMIAIFGLGYDKIDVNAASERGVFVVNARSSKEEETVADYTMGLLLAVARRITEADSYVKSRRWGSAPRRRDAIDVYGKTLGIVGLGRIGGAVAERASAFKMKLLYYDVVRSKCLEDKLGIIYTPLEDLLRDSDFVSIHTMLTEKTYHLIGKKEIDLMKPTAYILNTSRGKVIDEVALVEALEKAKIAGAALDVFETEPLSSDSPLLTMSNVILSPHMAGSTTECWKRVMTGLIENVTKFLNGERPIEEDIVNRESLR